MGHAYANHIDYETLKDGPKRLKLGSQKLYFQSKFVRLSIPRHAQLFFALSHTRDGRGTYSFQTSCTEDMQIRVLYQSPYIPETSKQISSVTARRQRNAWRYVLANGTIIYDC